MNPRMVGLVSVTLLGLAGLMIISLSVVRYDRDMPYWYSSWQPLFVGVLLMLFGLFIYLWLTVTPPEDVSWAMSTFVARVPQAVFHSFFTLLLVLDVWALAVFLLFPEAVNADPKSSHGRDIQIFACIAAAGLLGGFVRQFQSTLRPRELVARSEQSAHGSSFVRFWSLIASLVAALFTSVVLFLLLRAGILKSVEVDTFNIYGVTGVAAISGYFSENILRRFSRVYETLFDPGEKETGSKGG